MMDEKKYMDMVRPVARQMCILAGLNPDQIMYVSKSETLLHHEKLMANTHMFPGREMWGVKAPYAPNDVMLERVHMPPYRAATNDEIGPTPLWATFRAAAYDAILGHYAVNQVILAGKEVPA